ncbi:hypothetical protein VNO78_16236 [Psophocarpus tetragonolobus]|uniref:Uncharacterized protein n=1 Tax=Psophocarpus tetragonolobus TaxID=3891 RepID=A0AAN9SFX7_PSOTE
MQKEEQSKEGLDSLTCPSFNYYFTDDKRTQNDDALSSFRAAQNDDADFEFAAFREELGFGFPFDDVVFPLFSKDRRSGGSDAAVLRFPITGEELQRSERESSQSSSEEDESEQVPAAATFCAWRRNSPPPPPATGKCKKSKSTGSSSVKKWKLLNLLRRSNSEGEESLMFLAPSPARVPEKKKVNARLSFDGAGKSLAGGGEKKAAVSAHEALYVRNRELRSIGKKKSFLPYKPNLVGFCTGRFTKEFSSS